MNVLPISCRKTIVKMDLKKMEEVYRKWENKSGTAPHTTTTCMSGNERLRDKFREDPPLERQRRRARKRSGPPTLVSVF